MTVPPQIRVRNLIDIATSSEIKLFQDPTYDVSDTLENEWTGRVVGYVVDKDMPVYRYLDPQLLRSTTGGAAERIGAGFSGIVRPCSVDPTSWARR
jgi:hypothetical protein